MLLHSPDADSNTSFTNLFWTISINPSCGGGLDPPDMLLPALPPDVERDVPRSRSRPPDDDDDEVCLADDEVVPDDPNLFAPDDDVYDGIPAAGDEDDVDEAGAKLELGFLRLLEP
jgi:hypothetical protein